MVKSENIKYIKCKKYIYFKVGKLSNGYLIVEAIAFSLLKLKS